MNQHLHAHDTNQTNQQLQFNSNPFTLGFGELSKAFKINQNPAIFILVASFIIGSANYVSEVVNSLLEAAANNSDGNTQGIAALFYLLFISFSALVFGVLGVLTSGINGQFGSLNAEGKSTDIKSLLKGALKNFFPILGLTLLVALYSLLFILPAIILLIIGAALSASGVALAGGIMITIGVIAFIVGLVFSIRVSLARNLGIYIYFAEQKGIMASLSRSVELTKGRLIEVLGMGIPGIIPIVGAVLTPVTLGAHYLQLKTYHDSTTPMPKIHWLNWLLPLCVIGLAVLVVGLFVLIFSLAAVSTT